MKKRGISRRTFLSASGAVIGWAGLGGMRSLAAAADAKNGSTTEMLKAFIVSDAHFGWADPAQPTPAQQRSAIAQICKRFPDLDLFLDTGDLHHNTAPDQARADWTSVISNGCGAMPMYYANGNHDMMDFTVPFDAEWRTQRITNITCRPYYSFDAKGIHFVALSQLINAGYNTEESLAWLKLDLDLNQDKTVVILSQNSIRGTTFPKPRLGGSHDTGYRLVTNTEAVLAILDSHPSVVAWMHGHNHDWTMVPKNGRLYVSNGRIGGFDPNLDFLGHLGGIYIEVARNSFSVRSYSATHDIWLDTISGQESLKQVIPGPTSFDPQASRVFSYGAGRMRNGQRLPLYNHHVYEQVKRTLYMTGAESPVFNENSDIKTYCERHETRWHTKELAGFSVAPGKPNSEKTDTTWEWANPGIRIFAPADPGEERTAFCPGAGEGHNCYFRCAPGQRYRAQLQISSADAGTHVSFVAQMIDSNRNIVAHIRSDGGKKRLKGGAETVDAEFQIPPLETPPTIYSDPSSDLTLHMLIGAHFTEITKVIVIERFQMTLADAGTTTLNPVITLDAKPYASPGNWRRENSLAFRSRKAQARAV